MSTVSPFVRGVVATPHSGTWSLGINLLCCFRTRSRRRSSTTVRGKSDDPEDDEVETEERERLQVDDGGAPTAADGCLDDVDQSMMSTKNYLTADEGRGGVVMSDVAEHSLGITSHGNGGISGNTSITKTPDELPSTVSYTTDFNGSYTGDKVMPESSAMQLQQVEDLAHLFDVSDLTSGNDSATSCGRCRVTVRYLATPRPSVETVVHETRELPTGSGRGRGTGFRIHMVLLPDKSNRHRTKLVRSVDTKAEDDVTVQRYEETFRFAVTPDTMALSLIRFRVYVHEKLRKRRLIGECTFYLSLLEPDAKPTTHWLTMEPRTGLAACDSGSDYGSCGDINLSPNHSIQTMGSGDRQLPRMRNFRAELLVGLGYNSTTGRLTIVVDRGNNFRVHGSSKQPDTFVKLVLTDEEGRESARGTTSTVSRQSNPVYTESFVFRVPRSKLVAGYVTILVSVCVGRGRVSSASAADHMIGWFSLGRSSSGDDERSHWNELTASLSSTPTRSSSCGTPVRTSTETSLTTSDGTAVNSVAGTTDTGSVCVARWHQLIEP